MSSLSPDLRVQGMLEDTRRMARAAFVGGPDKEKAVELIRKLDVMVDTEQESLKKDFRLRHACKPGCDHCCYRIVMPSGPEVQAIAEFVEEKFSEDEKKALFERVDEYEKETAPFRDGCAYVMRSKCPFLIDRQCSIYEVRPFVCRSANAQTANTCKEYKEGPYMGKKIDLDPPYVGLAVAAAQGISASAQEVNLNPGFFELGPAVKAILEKRYTFEDLMTKPNLFPPMLDRVPPTEFPIIENKANGYARSHPQLLQFRELALKGELEQAKAQLTIDTEPAKFSMMRLPYAFRSEEHITETWEKWDADLTRLMESDYDPIETFNAIAAHETFAIAYMGRSVKELMAKHGQFLHNGVAKRALPHLCEPITTKRKPGKIRVGYISENIRNSNGARWALGWIANHSDDIESYVFNVGLGPDLVSLKFKLVADHYYHIMGGVDLAAQFIKDLDLDLLIFPDIGMTSRPFQFGALRLARYQATAWGHPVTCGLDTMDFYLSSDLMEPEDAQNEYTEKLIRLPGSGLYYEKWPIEPSRKTLADFGLNHKVHFMGQTLLKWLPRHDHLFAKIYEATKCPVVIAGPNFESQRKIWHERLGALGTPYVLLPRLPMHEFNRLLSLSECSFDPLEWSGGNSTIEALDVGVPVVTLPGKWMRGRHSLAFLKQANAEGLIAKDEDDFVDLIANEDRRREAMKHMDVRAVYEDKKVPEALNDFIRSLVE
ncbi:MAG: YkgJ family cysteine cluster protein [Armatimonadetes bacterium]|nr:YkgJ family cysteine cluster protein [Armatimonadota bacterium]